MVQPLQERIESNWETLKDKVKESLDKVVEAVGTYPIAPDDLGLVPVSDIMPVLPVKKRKATRKTAVAKRPAAKSATAGLQRTSRLKATKRARKSA
jgi:hypothetical protein